MSRRVALVLVASLLTAASPLAIAASTEHPAIDTQASPAAAATTPEMGTNIVGEREAAVGLYLLPWQEESPGVADRPPARYDEPLQALDTQRFDNRVANDLVIAAFRRSRLSRN